MTSVISTFPVFLSSHEKIMRLSVFLRTRNFYSKSDSIRKYLLFIASNILRVILPNLKSISPNIKSVTALADFTFVTGNFSDSSPESSSTTDAISSFAKCYQTMLSKKVN